MRKLVLTVAFFVAANAWSQKNEIKAIKKIYEKEQISAEELGEYKGQLLKLKDLATSPDDKISYEFYKSMAPLVELTTLGANPNPAQMAKILNPTAIKEIVAGIKSTLDYEKSTGKKVYTTDINETLTWLKPMLQQAAYALNNTKKYKEGSEMFYNMYQLDNSDVSNLENAAILAVQAQDFPRGEMLYREIVAIGFNGTGKKAFQISQADGTKMLATLAFENKNYEVAKKDFETAKQFNPNDVPMLTNEANMYYLTGDIATYKKLITEVLVKDPNNATLQYNVGYLLISEDTKLVEEINANLKNAKKYDELTNKRKEMFKNALPYFEKAYQLDATNQDAKAVLKVAYEILGMKDKAAMVK